MPINKKSLCAHLGHDFSNMALLVEALTHRSFHKVHNERLEFLGDAVLGLVIGEQIYRRFPQVDEGKLTHWRATLVNESTLAEVARELHLGTILRLGQGEQSSGGHDRSSILSDALEAIMGAIYLDGGFEAVQGAVVRLFQNRIQRLSVSLPQKDPKTRLQEYLQAKKISLPNYQVVKMIGKDHERKFMVECQIPGQTKPAKGQGSTRRGAEQSAAEQALLHLGASE